MQTVQINGKEYKVKYTIRALFIWENIMDKPFEIKSLMDNYVLFYAMILANNPGDLLSWEDFTNALDDNPYLIKEMGDIIAKQNIFNNMLDNSDKEQNSGKSSEKKS